MKLHNRPTLDLVHQAVDGMTEELALFSVKEFLNRPDATIKMYYQVIEHARFDSVKLLAESGLLKNKFGVNGDISWLATNAHNDEIALLAVWALQARPSVSAHEWRKVAQGSRSEVVRLRAQEALVVLEDAILDDLLWLDENGQTNDIKSAARLRLRLTIG